MQKYKDKELYLFDSSLREDFSESSDIDMLYEFEFDSGSRLFDVL